MIYWLASLVTLLYTIGVWGLWRYWRRIPVSSDGANSAFVSTVILPVRNEANHIERLIRSIYYSPIPISQFEIIVVDDDSSDLTLDVVKRLQLEFENLFVTQLPSGKEGKKSAITFGVKMARGELIICTDGDSEVSADWLEEHRVAYASGARLAFGPVRLFNTPESRWTDMLNQELAALVAMGAATLQMGRPTMINGCNYSFSKEAFKQVRGFEGNEQIATGDDEFLLRKIHEEFPSQILFLKSPNALVTSEPPKSVKAFYHQRRRWASKWKFHQDWNSKLLPVFLFLCYVVWCAMLVDVLVFGNHLGMWLLGGKLLTDYIYIRSASRIQKSKMSILNFLGLQIIYPFYVVFFGVASNFGAYSWRERTHKI